MANPAQRGPSDAPANLATTLGELKAGGYHTRSVKEELRQNLIRKLEHDEPLFEGIVGFEETVVPQVENAILSGQDIIFLGERGQAKTRLARTLPMLLDEWLPIVAGCEINDDPLRPICWKCRGTIEECGDAAPIEWLSRERRYGEKLATPDITIADLIGEVDPIKVAEGRYLSDELTIHFGLLPRTHRGIFVINELPDLAERIQVGLLNIMEERDVQIRGYKVRLPLDLFVIASANPEDYTNRGRIITPLKDRFGSQIRTHYPKTVEHEMDIMEQERGTFKDEEYDT
ncbi:MAG: AAA family ATPase, partial [Chloroflexi bacterium]|nr:AAA family ATPase [Chloroflexota bacterium]